MTTKSNDCVCGVEPGVRFPEESADDIQKQKQLLKDAAAFLVSCQVPTLVSDASAPKHPAELSWCVKSVDQIVFAFYYKDITIMLNSPMKACVWLRK